MGRLIKNMSLAGQIFAITGLCLVITAGGALISAATLFATLSIKMAGRLAQWHQGNGFATIRADWLARAAGLGKNIRVRLADREVAGRFDAIDEEGSLVLIEPDGGKMVIAAGDVLALEGSR